MSLRSDFGTEDGDGVEVPPPYWCQSQIGAALRNVVSSRLSTRRSGKTTPQRIVGEAPCVQRHRGGIDLDRPIALCMGRTRPSGGEY